MKQVARNITAVDGGFLRGTRYLILDRDAKYSSDFCGFLAREGLDVIRLPPRSPNLNAFAERFVRSIKSECLNRMIFFGPASLRHAIGHFMVHYHHERNHQGVGNRLLQSTAGINAGSGPVKRRRRLGGMLGFYHCAAAA
jgi:putative transposase